MAVTIKKIAELAGVSPGTVDRALYNRGRVKPEVADRIKQIAQSLNYVPNKAARTLSISKKNHKIAVILHTDNNPFFSLVIKGIEKATIEAQNSGIPVTLFPGKNFDASYQLSLIDKAIEEGYSAIIIVPIENELIKEKLNILYESNFPVFLLTNIISKTNYKEYIGCDYYKAGNLMAGITGLIASEQDRSILFITPSFRMMGHRLRFSGFIENTRIQQGHFKTSILEIKSEDTIEIYKQCITTFESNTPDIIIVTGGQLESGVLKAITDRDLKSKIFVFDCTEKVESLIKENVVTACIDQRAQSQGYDSVMSALNSIITYDYPENKNRYLQLSIILKESF